MKAVEFIIGVGIICEYYDSVEPCTAKNGEKCPLFDCNCDLTSSMSVKDAERLQDAVEKWMDEHKDIKGGLYESFKEIDK